MPPWVTALVGINSSGYYFQDYPSFLAALTAQYQSIYGSDVYLGPDSQDGQFLAILVQAFYYVASVGGSTYNSFSPATAQGVGLSRLVKINGLSRLPASFSTVNLTVGGTAGTVITNGVAQDILGQLWLLPSPITIPSGGELDLQLSVAQFVGAVNAAEGTVTTIYTPTIGWQTVTNSGPATPGAAVESDAALRIRQAASTSLPAQTVNAATAAALGNLPFVTKVFYWENFTNSSSGSTLYLPAHSINFNVVGPSTTAQEIEVAQVILNQKTPGTTPVGNTSETAYDNQGLPQIIYFNVAVNIEISVNVTGSVIGNTYNDAISKPLIQAAVAAYINALPIGAYIAASALYIPAYLQGTSSYGTYNLTEIQVKETGGSFGPSVQLNQGLASDGSGAQNGVCVAATDVNVSIS